METEIRLRSGMAGLLFGMKEQDVKALYGEPDRKYKDEDKNVIYLYDGRKLRLTFYQDEGFRLGYIITSNPDAVIHGAKVIGGKWEDVQEQLAANKLQGFEKETFDSVDNYFNEANWIIFHVEFGEVIRVELGAIINSKDEFDWKF